MSALADRSEDNNEDNNSQSNLPSFTNSTSMSTLSMEKQFTHTMFINQIQTISLEQAKELLEELHLLYLSQGAMFIKMTKQEFLDNLDNRLS